MAAPAPTSQPSPSSARTNRRTKDFHFLFSELPEDIQVLARKMFKLFLKDPSHGSLGVHRLKDTKRGSHTPGSVSVRINMQYRAIYVEDGLANLWYWVGTHAKYNHFTGKN